MVTEVFPNIFLIEIPLPNFTLKKVNSYVILSEEQNLIVDTGFNTEEGREAFRRGLGELNVDLGKTKLLLTHMHPDHTGMASWLQHQGATAYIGKHDGRLINKIYSETSKTRLEILYEELSEERDVMPTRANFFGDNSTEDVALHLLNNSDTIQIGPYRFEVMDIPGHTPGHIGLYERKHRLFFCGDHILERISPSVVFWGFEKDILGLYLQSLRKVSELEIDQLFTAHQSILYDHRGRIRELLAHSDARLEEVRTALAEGRKTPREVASRLHWNVNGTWEDFAKDIKFFAVGETLTFLEHLVHLDLAVRTRTVGNIFYQLAD